jgi:hypothetical protein
MESASREALDGGIDIQDISVEKKTSGTRIQFNDAAMKAVLEKGFDGFTPVFIRITPMASPLAAMGISDDAVAPARVSLETVDTARDMALAKEPEFAENAG